MRSLPLWSFGGFLLSLLMLSGCGNPTRQCLRDCGTGCPAPESQPCASNGSRYCSTCVLACYGLSVAPPSVCDGGDASDEEAMTACLTSCDEACSASDAQACASDGNRYCGVCSIACHGLTERDDAFCEVLEAPFVDVIDVDDQPDGVVPSDATPSEDVDAGDIDALDDGTNEDADSDDIQACLAACGVGCPAPALQPCASDGNRYCNTCIIACNGLSTEADDGHCRVVEDCPGPVGQPPVAWRTWDLPEVCWTSEFEDMFEVFPTEAAVRDSLACDGSPDLGVDFDTERLVRTVIPERTDGEVLGVWEEDDGLAVHLRSPAYCGGAAPPNLVLWVVIPAADTAVRQDVCSYGACDWGDTPPP